MQKRGKMISKDDILQKIRLYHSGKKKRKECVGLILNECKKHNLEIADDTIIDLVDDAYGVKKLPIIGDADLDAIDVQPPRAIVDGTLYKKGVFVIAGKTGAYKTSGCLSMGYSIAEGLNVFDIFPTLKGPVLYIDQENGDPLRVRAKKIKKGLGIRSSSNVYFLSFSSIMLDNPSWIARLERTLRQIKPVLIIVDGYRRVISFKEDEAGPTSHFFQVYIRPLIERYDVSFLFIHHLKKDPGKGFNTDPLDQLRGSSDLVNYADGVLTMQRKGNNILFRQLKNRHELEFKPKLIEVNSTNDAIIMSCSGDMQEPLSAVDYCAESILHIMQADPTSLWKAKIVKSQVVGYSLPTINRAFDSLIPSKIIREKKGYYKLVPERINVSNVSETHTNTEISNVSDESTYNKEEHKIHSTGVEVKDVK